MHKTPHTESTPRSDWPSTSYKPFFLHNNNLPSSILASVVKASSDITTFAVTCPPSLCENDYPEQTIIQYSDTLWVGASFVEDVAMEKWACNLNPDASPVRDGQAGWCMTETITGLPQQLLDGSEAISTAVDTCFVQRRMVVGVITAGMDKVYEIENYHDPGYLDDMIQSLADVPCLTAEPDSIITHRSNDGDDEDDSNSDDLWGWVSVSNARSGIFGDVTGSSSTETTAAETAEPTDDGPATLPRSLALLLGSSILTTLATW